MNYNGKEIKFEAIFESLDVAVVSDEDANVFDVNLIELPLPFDIHAIRECWQREIIMSKNWVEFEDYVNYNILKIDKELFNLEETSELSSRWELGLEY
jgi:hypothetical protein